jgi:hypothetical protein
MGEMKYFQKDLVEKTERKRLFWRSRSRWKENIKMCFEEIGFEDVS